MQKSLTLNVRLGGVLSDFVSSKIGEHGEYENISEYVRDLIRQDKTHKEKLAFERLKNELKQAFNEPESNYISITASDIISRNASR